MSSFFVFVVFSDLINDVAIEGCSKMKVFIFVNISDFNKTKFQRLMQRTE